MASGALASLRTEHMEKSENNPIFCVVTPVRNGEKYLSETIESVLGQTLVNWEYIIVDGGSNDNSVNIASSYAKNDPRIKVISGPDNSLYDALFKGFKEATAPICCWINADDKLMPWAFELVTKYMKFTAAEWVTGIPAVWDEKGLLHYVEPPSWYPRLFIRLGLFHGRCLGWIQQESTFFSRSLLNRIDETAIDMIRRQKLAGDFLLWAEFAKYSSLHTLPTVISGFRIHSNNASKNMDAYFAEISIAGFRIPPRLVGKLMKYTFIPFSLFMGSMTVIRRRESINRLE